MKQLYFLLLQLFFCTRIFSQPSSATSGITYQPLTAYSDYQVDMNSFTANQAVLAKKVRPGISVTGERRYMLDENSVYTATGVLSTPLGGFGFQLSHTGGSLYRQDAFGLAYAHELGKLALGVQFNFTTEGFKGYQSVNSLNAEFALLMPINKDLHTGIQIINPTDFFKRGMKSIRPTSLFQWGIGYDLSEQFYVGAALIKSPYRSVHLLTNFQYQFGKKFIAKAGLQSETGSLLAGAGLVWGNLRLDLTVNQHPQLGISPGMNLMYWFKSLKP
jgi:hypothetical protein